MNDKKQLARRLYFEGKTQKEIAEIVGVSERTIHTWVHQYAWNKLRQASYQAPITIANNFSSQLVELQNEIASRPPGKRYPTPQEAEISRKLQNCITGTKKTASLSQNMQMMELFRDFVRPLNDQFSRQLAHYSAKFLETEARKGFKPYEVEYGMDAMAISPYYDELNGEEAIDTTTAPEYPKPCTHPQYCLHEGNCKWPACKNVLLTIDDLKETRVENTPWQPLPEPLLSFPEIFLLEPEKTAETIDNTGISPLPVPSPDRKQPEENPQFLATLDILFPLLVSPVEAPLGEEGTSEAQIPAPEVLSNPTICDTPKEQRPQHDPTFEGLLKNPVVHVNRSFIDPPARDVLGKG